MAGNSVDSIEVAEQPVLPLADARELLDMVYLANALLKTGGNVSRAAEELEIARRTIYDLMQKHGISCAEGSLSIQITPLLQHIELRAPWLERYINTR